MDEFNLNGKVKLTTYAKMNNVTYRTAWNWYKRGLLKTELNHYGSIYVLLDQNNKIKEPKVAIYARVSSSENKSNLETQKERLISYANAKGYKIEYTVTEIGSGLNDNRPKLLNLLLDKNIDIIIVEHKDRLSRFGVNYIEKLLDAYGRQIEIINKEDDKKENLMEDFVSIVTSFCTRIYGNRRSKRQTEKIIEALNKEE